MTERENKREHIDKLAKEFHLTWSPWQKKVKLVYEIHCIFKELDVSWTQKDTAEFLDHSFSHISESCRLAQALEDPMCEPVKSIVNRVEAMAFVRGVKKWKRI